MRRVATAIVALTFGFAVAAAAQEPLEYKVTVKGEIIKGSFNDHFVTFSGPVQIPDVTLAAGTYKFSIVSPSLVQVSSVDRGQVGLFFTAPVQRLQASADYEMTLVPTGEKSPRRIAKWFVPNQTLGFEFLYPKDETVGER